MAKPTMKRTSEAALAPPGSIQLDEKGNVSPSSLLNLNAFVELMAQALMEVSMGDGANYSKAGNLAAQVITFTTHGAGVEFGLDHSLKRRPWGRFIVGQNKAGSLYRTNVGSWSPTRVFFTSNTASMLMTIILF